MTGDVPESIPADALSLLRFRGKVLYACLLLTTVALAFLSYLIGNTADLILTIPVIVVLALAVFIDRRTVHIPPVLIIMMMLTFLLSFVGRAISEGNLIVTAANFLLGINFGLLGLMVVYMLLRSRPGDRDESPALVALCSTTFSLATFMLMKMLQHFISLYWDGMEPVEVGLLMSECLMVVLGSVLVCIMYSRDSTRDLFKHTLGFFLEANSETLGIEDWERNDVLRLIASGESERLEFKSTIRTNLQTGQVDKRIEKAVLKTIVAFLNSDGGTLLIGVADDGTVRGVDLDSFESRDKMSLHLTNLISSQIGNGFLPFISFGLVDFEEGTVVRVRCEECPRPVFLKDGKVELFYVRSGPSSVELTGMNLINYVNNRQRGDKRTARSILRSVAQSEIEKN